MARAQRKLQCPRVCFEPGLLAHVQSLVLGLSAARERREGAGRLGTPGVGEEFVGFRAYRPGDDLRLFDWNLFARLDTPYVRVMRRESSEEWTVLLDRSASMGVGPPGKLQRAAECALALAAFGVRAGARVRIVHSALTPEDNPAGSSLRPAAHVPSNRPGASELTARRPADLARVFERLDGLEARDSGSVEQLFPAARGGRVFLLGDLFDLEPDRLAHLRRRGRRVAVWMFQAPHELRPQELGDGDVVEWLDPESDQHVSIQLDRRTREAFAGRSLKRLDAWRTSARSHRMGFTLADTSLPLAEILRRGVESEF